MSYINKKTRAFRTVKDVKLQPRRSDSRMKEYPSAIDFRAWCDTTEDRRQHILEIVKYGNRPEGLELLPYDLLMSLLLHQKAAESAPAESETPIKAERKIDKEAIKSANKSRPQSASAKDTGAKTPGTEAAGTSRGEAKPKTQIIIPPLEEVSSTTAGPAGEGDDLKFTPSSDTVDLTTTDSSAPAIEKPRKNYCKCTMNGSGNKATSGRTSIPDIARLFEEDEECPCGEKCPGRDLDGDAKHECMFGLGATESPIQKVEELENKLILKKKRTKQKIDVLKTTLDRFKKQLYVERERNSNLVNRYCNQAKAIESMQLEISSVKEENCQDKRKLAEINNALKKILSENVAVCDTSSSSQSYSCCGGTEFPTRPRRPRKTKNARFQANINIINLDKRFKHDCSLNAFRSCSIMDDVETKCVCLDQRLDIED